VLGDLDNEWIPVDDSIIAVIELVSSGLFGTGLFSPTYQAAIQYMPLFPSGGGLDYWIMQKQNLALNEELFIGDKVLVFQRMQNRIYIDVNWKETFSVGQFLIFDCYKAIHEETNTKVYSNYFVREYATALIKQQWGQNLTKFSGIQLPNGTTLNGEQIYQQGVDRITELEERLRNEFQAPPGLFVG